MKPTRAFLLLFVILLPLCAQQPNQYGVVGVAAIIPTANGKDETVRLATELAAALRKDGILTIKGDVQLIGEPTEPRVLTIVGTLAIDWLALVRFDPKDQAHGVYTIDVVHVVSQKIVSRALALFGTIRTAQDMVSREILREATNAKNAVISRVTQFQRIWIHQDLLTDPPEAEFYFGGTANRTDKDGVGHWDGTLPPGPTNLRVLKEPAYPETVIAITVPSTQCSPCVLPYQTIHLTKKP
jgi:hypothetical protein